MSNSSVPTTTFWTTIGILCIVLGAGGYFMYQGHLLALEQQEAVRRLTDQIESTEISLQRSIAEHSAANELSRKELMTQVAAVRVAIQQSSNIRFDRSGAVITKKGQISDGVELR